MKSKRPTVVKAAGEGSKRIVQKTWDVMNSGKDKHSIDMIEQVMPCGSMLMTFEEERARMESLLYKKKYREN